jgi:hypothetical protein
MGSVSLDIKSKTAIYRKIKARHLSEPSLHFISREEGGRRAV